MTDWGSVERRVQLSCTSNMRRSTSDLKKEIPSSMYNVTALFFFKPLERLRVESLYLEITGQSLGLQKWWTDNRKDEARIATKQVCVFLFIFCENMLISNVWTISTKIESWIVLAGCHHFYGFFFCFYGRRCMDEEALLIFCWCQYSYGDFRHGLMPFWGILKGLQLFLRLGLSEKSPDANACCSQSSNSSSSGTISASRPQG